MISNLILVLLFLGGLAVLYHFGKKALHNSDQFIVEDIQIEGASSWTAVELRPNLANLYKRNIFALDLDAIREITLEHPWVENVLIFSQLPSTLKVVVTEREPIGIVRYENFLYLIGEGGEVISRADRYSGKMDLPIITGIANFDASHQKIVKALQTLDHIKSVSSVFWNNIETLDVSDNDNMVVQLRNVGAPVSLGNKIVDANLRNYLTIARHIENHYPSLDYIELGFPNQIAIMPKR